MTKRNYLFGTTVLAGFLATVSPSLAQTAQPAPAARQIPSTEEQQADTVEEIVVTGSRIARPQYEGVIPGVQVGSQDIE